MCLAIYKPASTKPDWDAYANGFFNNDDSWGFAAVVNGQLHCERGIGRFSEFRDAFEPYADCQAVIHFRYATHGDVDTANAHPFMVSKRLAMIHNGILDIDCNLNKKRSDTWHYVELILKPMHASDPDFFEHQHMAFVMGTAIKGSKFVFLHADGRYAIWNKEDGVDAKDGHWYSNTGHQACRYGWSTSTKYTRSVWSDAFDKRSTLWDDKPRSTAVSEPATERLTEDEKELLASLQDDSDDTIEEDDDDATAYTEMRRSELLRYGFSGKCIDEVLELLGHFGVEALHDLI